MSTKSTDKPASLADIAREVNKYSEGAYHFVRDGLEYAAQSIHGPMTPPQLVIARYMSEQSIDLAEVIERLEDGSLDAEVAAAIKEAGGIDGLNRNVSGHDLCWALRDFALRRWGNLADVVLRHWNVKCTQDFGRIVFALVEHGLMQKEPHDSASDFKDVFDFDEALTKCYRIDDSPDE